MRNLKFFTLLFLAAFLLVAPKAEAVVAVEGETAVVEAPTLTKQQERQVAKMEKRMERYEKRLAKRGQSMDDVDFSDPVKKWMWFWIFGWAGGLILSVVAGVVAVGTLTAGGLGIAGILWLLASLAWLFGTVSLVVWLVKMNT